MIQSLMQEGSTVMTSSNTRKTSDQNIITIIIMNRQTKNLSQETRIINKEEINGIRTHANHVDLQIENYSSFSKQP